MRTISARPATLFLILLVAAMLCAGCASSEDSATASSSRESDGTRTVSLGSDQPVHGEAHGNAFALDRAEMQNGILTLHGDDGMAFFVFLFLEDGQTVEGRSYRVEQADFGDPHIHMHYREQGSLEIDTFMDKYALELELGHPEGDKLPGRISLRLPDDAGSAIEGSFVASYTR